MKSCPKCKQEMFQVFFGENQIYPVWRCITCDKLTVDHSEPQVEDNEEE